MSKTETAARTSIVPMGYCTSEGPDSVELTVYQQGGLAVVREQRRVALMSGPNQLYLEGMPTAYELNSLTALDYKGPGVLSLGPVSYRAANLDKQRILQESVGNRVVVKEVANNGRVSSVSGTLKAVIGHELAVERHDNRRLMLVPSTQVELDSLPPGLSSTPSLMMLPTASVEGNYQVGLLYEAGGLQWSARYAAFYDEKTNKLSRFQASVSVTNGSGARFQHARVQLLAGANYSRRPQNYGLESMAMAAPAGGMRKQAFRAASAPAVESIGEVKAYELPERVTISDGETQQVTLFLANDVPVKREYFLSAGGYYSTGNGEPEKLPIYVRLRLENTLANHLGKALPAGDVSILQPDASGSQQKTFSSAMDAVAEGEAFKLEFGPSSDIKAERVLLSSRDFAEAPLKPAPTFPIKPQGNFVSDAPHLLPGMEEAHCVSEGPHRLPGSQPDFIREPFPVVEDNVEGEEVENVEYRLEERKLTVYNYKAEAVEVLVNEQFPDNAVVVTQPDGYPQLKTHAGYRFAQEGNEGKVTVKVAAKGKTVLRYSLKYRTN